MSAATVLVLGVGGPQVDAIGRLRARGHHVVACGWRRDGPGLAGCDGFVLQDLRDPAGVAALARRIGATAVVPIGSDLALATAIAVAHELNLPSFVPADVLPFVRDKHEVRAALAGGPAAVEARRATVAEDLSGWSCFPAAVKPVDGQGQRGVFRCVDAEALVARFPAALAASRCGAVLVEEWLDGPERSAHLWRDEGVTSFFCVTDRVPVPGHEGGAPLRHEWPSRASAAEVDALLHLADAACTRLGYDDGPVYVQARATPRGPRLVELSPRLDGCHLWRLIGRACGVDLLDRVLRGLCGGTSAPLTRCRSQCGGEPLSLGFFHGAPGSRFVAAEHRAPLPGTETRFYLEDGDLVPDGDMPLVKLGYWFGTGRVGGEESEGRA